MFRDFVVEELNRAEEERAMSYLVTSPELLKSDLRYACENGIEITITFMPELQNRWRPETLTYMVREQFDKYNKRYDFTLVLIGEFSQTGVYHMHGALKTEAKMVNSIRRNFGRLFGRTELKGIKYSETWFNYCLKDENQNRANYAETKKELYKNLVIWINPTSSYAEHGARPVRPPLPEDKKT